MWRRWVSTVFSLRNSWAAISRLVLRARPDQLGDLPLAAGEGTDGVPVHARGQPALEPPAEAAQGPRGPFQLGRRPGRWARAVTYLG
jgi:hypothetical protein